jgi:tRNA(Arg) A34 adenosine deaminase TadA
MTMDEAEFRMAVTHALAHRHAAGGDIAILWDKRKPLKVQVAPRVNAADTNLELPVVRLLRTLEKRPRNGSITTTAAPTEACLGMARMCGIDYITYLDKRALKKVATERSKTTESAVVMTAGSTYPDVTQSGTPVAWSVDPSQHGRALLDWFDERAKTPGSSCDVARTLIPQQAVPATSFASSGLEYLGLKSIVGDQTVVDNVFMMLAWEMVAQVSGFQSDLTGDVSEAADARSNADYAGQNIGSLLVDEDGNILAWGFNTNKNNPTRHGEINLIGSYFATEGASALPARGTIYTTLEPCEMCSGAICRTVPANTDFRVIYGQKDVNVYSTALQRAVKARIAMTGSQAAMATADMIRSGSARAATVKLVDHIKSRQDDAILGNEKFKATTAFLKEESTYKTFFAGARPQWWLYLWDHLASKLPPPVTPVSSVPAKTAGMAADLASAEAIKLNNQLDIMYQLVERFMKAVAAQARV